MTVASEAPPVPARPASTVALVRDGGSTGIETYLLRRPSTSTFAPDAYVFPGGVLDPADMDSGPLLAAAGFDLAAAAMRMAMDGTDEDRRRCGGHHVAAVREVLEETGILLGASHHPSSLVDFDRRRSMARNELVKGSSLSAAVEGHGLVICPEKLVYAAHFFTPLGWPRRYDTRFFVARAPEDQEPTPQPSEASEGRWWAVAEIVAHERCAGIRLMPPTQRLCSALAAHTSVEEALIEFGTRPLR